MAVLSHILKAIVAFWQLIAMVNDSITDCSSVDAVSTQHWWAQVWIQPPEWCYKGLMETRAPECRYLGKEVSLARDRTFPHAEDDSVLHPILKADFREVYFLSTLFPAEVCLRSIKMYPKPFKIKSWGRWYHPQQAPFYQYEDVCFLVAVD